MRERGEVRVVADQVGTPTAAFSLAQVLWALATTPPAGGVFHWTDAGVASWYDFAVAIAEEAHALGLLARPAAVRPISTADYPTPAARPSYSVLDWRATADATGIEPRHWRDNLRTVLQEAAGA
jgi:dTDP-4-dehydrorhamnose reductase